MKNLRFVTLPELAVEQKNRAHKVHSVAHRLNLHAQMLQIKRGCISKHIYQSIKFLIIISWVWWINSCAVQVISQPGWQVKNNIERRFFCSTTSRSMREKEQGLKKDQGCKDRPNIETGENRTTKRFKKVKGELGLPPKPESGSFLRKG